MQISSKAMTALPLALTSALWHMGTSSVSATMAWKSNLNAKPADRSVHVEVSTPDMIRCHARQGQPCRFLHKR